MTTGEKIYTCRKQAGMTQEELAERLGVSRQAVSKWEQDGAFPETKQIMELCKLFHISADELLFGTEKASAVEPSLKKDGEEERDRAPEAGPSPEEDGRGKTWGVIDHGSALHFEYISKRRILGMPLVHVNFGLGAYRAHGFFSFGIFAAGIFSAGIFAAGVLSAGIFSLGLLAFGSFVLGGLAFGSIAAGLAAFGGVAFGILAMGGVAVGQFAVGGVAVGQFAVGDWAQGYLAIGKSHAGGEHAFLIPDMLGALEEFLAEDLPEWISSFLSALAHILS